MICLIFYWKTKIGPETNLVAVLLFKESRVKELYIYRNIQIL